MGLASFPLGVGEGTERVPSRGGRGWRQSVAHFASEPVPGPPRLPRVEPGLGAPRLCITVRDDHDGPLREFLH
jgi:hypothetical protein